MSVMSSYKSHCECKEEYGIMKVDVSAVAPRGESRRERVVESTACNRNG